MCENCCENACCDYIASTAGIGKRSFDSNEVSGLPQCCITSANASDGTDKVLSHSSHLMRLCIKHSGLSVFNGIGEYCF